ncbi:MAG: hypothetical protein AUH86_19780 [Acidobacteria bacterium 13_1_40CM_4_58_4]|nr:MAG: hypothetical protein AUH86_19780 [Acidobacteria bacterium 13_1_40CM_4_58_4]
MLIDHRADGRAKLTLQSHQARASDSDSEQDHRYMIFARKAEEGFEGRMEKRLPIAIVERSLSTEQR